MIEMFAYVELYFDLIVSYSRLLMEAIGLVIIILTAVRCIMGMIGKRRNNYRIVLAKGICLALEFKLGGEVLDTVLAENFKDLGIIACLIALRASLTFLLHWEIKNEKKEELEDTEYRLISKEEFTEYEQMKSAGGQESPAAAKE